MVEILDVVIGAGMRPCKETIPKTKERVATLIGILDGLDGELGAERHNIADAERGGVSISGGVRPSAHERRSMSVTGRSDEGVSHVGELKTRVAESIVREDHGNYRVSTITNQD